MSQPDIYCEQCRVRPRELYCDWCNAHICRSCTESVHKCTESSHDINALAHAALQEKLINAALPARQSSIIDQPPIEINMDQFNQLNAIVKQENDLAIEFYKSQHDKLLERHKVLESEHEELNKKIKELETSNAAEIKAFADSYSTQVSAHIAEVEKKANEIIADYQAKISALESQNAALQSQMAESFKKVQSPMKPVPVSAAKINQQNQKEKPQWH